MDFQPWHIIILIVVSAASIALFISALVSIVKHPDASTTAKVVWIILVAIFPILAPLIWFVTGRSALVRKPGSA